MVRSFGKLSAEEKRYWILFAGITLLFLATRLFRLDRVPFTAYGMHFDEMAAAYDAWCIQGWGVDRHLVRYPVYFMNTGPGQNALYTYLAAIIFRLFGFSVFKYRLVAVICACGAYICLFFLSRKLFGKGMESLIPNALMTIMPVFLMSEHWGLESYLFLSFSTMSFYFLILSIEKRKTGYYILDGIFWGITLYTYGVSYAVIPGFFALAFICLIIQKRMDLKMALATVIPIILLGIPLAAQQLVMMDIIEPFSIFGMDFLQMADARVREISPAFIPYNLRTSDWVLLVKDYLPYSSVPQFGSIYYLSIPFMIAGLVLCAVRTWRSLKSRSYDPLALLFLFYLMARLISLMTWFVNTNKANELYFPWMMFTAVGIGLVCRKTGKKWCLPVIAGLYLICFLPFAVWAYTGGENSWNNMTKPIAEEDVLVDIRLGLAAREAKNLCGGRKIRMIINNVEGRYPEVALFTGTSPYDFNEEGYEENGYVIGVPEELDLSGDTVYLIEDVLHHITDYLVGEGFTNHVMEHGGFSIVYKELSQN